MFQGLPTTGLVVLLGAPASGKSLFAELAFPVGSRLSTDAFRALAGGNADNLDVTVPAHALLAGVAAQRLASGLLTVVDSTGTDATLMATLQEAAKHCECPIHYIHVQASLDECLRRNAARVTGRVPDAAILRIAGEVERTVAGLLEAGVPVSPGRSFLDQRLSGRRLFVAMPITEFMGRDTFRADKRALSERIHGALALCGASVASAALNEHYGATRLPAAGYADYDVREILAADCLLVWTTSSLSPDTYLEIGVAVGAGKPVGIVLPERCHRSGMLRGLQDLGRVTAATFDLDADLPRTLAGLAASLT